MEMNCNGNHNCELDHNDSVIMEEIPTNNHATSDSVSISESVIHKSSVTAQQKTLKVLKQVVLKEKTTTIQKVSLPTLFVTLLILVMAMFQIPTVLYYTQTPATNDFTLDGINLENCSVSLYGL